METALTHLADLRRPAYALAAVALLAAAIATFLHVDAGWWVIPVFAILPDLAFVAGAGRTSGLERGQMPARAVPVYNALHRLWGPLALAVLAVAGVVAPALLAGALVWAFHIALDRAVGYGLRTPDGFQRR